MDKRTIAVIGAGYWGKNLVRNFHDLGALHTVCDADAERLRQLSEQYSVPTTGEYQSVLDNPDIEGVVIALPAVLHYRFAKEALDAGKNVYVEKPLTVDIAEAEEVVSLADKKGKVLMVGHLLQYHPAFRRLKEMVHAGMLGRIYYIYSNRLSLGKIRQEENILWSFAPHDISMILSLCREEPDEVYATGGKYLQDQIADVTTTHMNFPSGVKSHIFVSWLHPFKEQKLVVVGKEKMAVFSDTEEWENKLLIYSHSIEWENGIPVPRKADPEKIVIEQEEPLRNECCHFIECMDKNVKPITDGEEGIQVLRVLQRAQESIERNR